MGGEHPVTASRPSARVPYRNGARLIVSYSALGAADNLPQRCDLSFLALVEWLRTEFYDRRGPGPKDGPYLSFSDYGTEPAWTQPAKGEPFKKTRKALILMLLGASRFHIISSYMTTLTFDLSQPAAHVISLNCCVQAMLFFFSFSMRCFHLLYMNTELTPLPV